MKDILQEFVEEYDEVHAYIEEIGERDIRSSTTEFHANALEVETKTEHWVVSYDSVTAFYVPQNV